MRLLFFKSARIPQALLLGLLLALLGCGGGGDSAGSTAPDVTTPAAGSIPNSGSFALLVKVELKTVVAPAGFSLIHPADRSTEYVIEPVALNGSKPFTLYSGTVDAVNSKVSNLSAHSLLYIAGGDVKRLPLAATGVSPKAALQVAGVTNLCDFVINNNGRPQGTDYGTPFASRYLATTKGLDNLCGTFDDSQVEISFDAQGKPQTAPVQNAATLGPVLAVLRNPATLKPAATVHGRAIAVMQPPTVYTLLADTAPAMTKAISVSVDALVGEQDNRLVFWDFSGKNIALDATITAGVGWASAGDDANNFYVYRNTGALGTLPTSTWKLVKISKTTPSATLLASGSGYIASASMGLNSLFITSANTSGFTLNRYSKAAPGAPVVLQGPSTTQVTAQLASREGVHLFLNNTTAANGEWSSIANIVEEETNKTLFSISGAMPFHLLKGTTLALNNSEDAVGFVIAAGFSSAAGSLGGTLISYDAAARTSIINGRMPSAAEFGYPTGILRSGGATGNNFGTGLLSAVSGTTIFSSPRRVFSFDPRVADSIQYATTVK